MAKVKMVRPIAGTVCALLMVVGLVVVTGSASDALDPPAGERVRQGSEPLIGQVPLSFLHFNMCGSSAAPCRNGGQDTAPVVEAIVDLALDDNNNPTVDAVSLNEACLNQVEKIHDLLRARTQGDTYGAWVEDSRGSYCGGAGQFGTAIISFTPVTGQANVHLSSRANNNMLCVATEVGTTVRLCSAHLWHGGPPDGADIRTEQTQAMVNALRGDQWERVPTVFMGDFNAETGWSEMDPIYDSGSKDELHVFTDAQLGRTRCHYDRNDPVTPCEEPGVPTHCMTNPLRKIDYIMFSGFSDISGGTEPPPPSDNGGFNGFVSDHLVVRATATPSTDSQPWSPSPSDPGTGDPEICSAPE